MEQERYKRHISLKEIGEEGQKKLHNAKVLIVGAGGLGSPVLLYVAAAGIGTIGIIDNDIVSESNLQRQVLYSTSSLGMRKVDCAKRRLSDLNPHCKIDIYFERLNNDNAHDIISKYDFVVDATDNLSSRYIINDVCVKQGKAFVYGSICEFNGQVSVFNYNGGPTYRDLYPYSEEVEHFTQSEGVIGTLPGLVGSIQASELIKSILGLPNLSGKLLLIDLLNNDFNVISM